jgi:hypothetical protein
MKINKPFLIRCKVYIDRARMYYGYASFPTLVILTINSFGGAPAAYFHKHPGPSMVVGVFFFIAMSLLIGRVDKKLGLFQEENKRHSELNPMMQKIIAKLDEILDKYD